MYPYFTLLHIFLNRLLFNGKKVASNEDLLRNILLRLPVKPLLRFKCVSKRWLALISEQRFCHSHTLRQCHTSRPFPSALLLATTSSFRCPIIPLKTSGSDSSSNFRYVKVPRMSITIMQSCNGLLLLEGKPLKNPNNPFKARHFVYNPTTNQYVAVNFPTLQFRSSVLSLFLSFEPLRSPHYKIISIRFRDFSTFSAMMNYAIATSSLHVNPDYVVNVYSSESGIWSDPGFSFTAPDHSNAVYCNGAIYWYIKDINSKYFDVENRCFKTFPMPLGINNQKVRYFGESGGHLYLVVQPLLNDLDILELNEDRSGWLVRFHVNLLHPMRAVCPHMNLFDLSPVAGVIDVFCVVRQENEVDSMLVFSIVGRVIAYNLLDPTFIELSSFNPFLSSGSRCDVFHYYENLSWVGPSKA